MRPTFSHYQSPLSARGLQLSVPYFGKRRSKKDEYLGDLKGFLPQIFVGELTMFLGKKYFVK